jgi:hypothetical protein
LVIGLAISSPSIGVREKIRMHPARQDYADMFVPFTPVDQRLRVKVGITRTSA